VAAHSRRYLECAVCRLIHVPPAHWLDAAAERAHYLTHENDPDDPRYRAFLARVAVPLASRLPAVVEGLDYGAGPGPTLALMMAEQGFPTTSYDPHFAENPGSLLRSYDFVTCTEVVEHFQAPGDEFERLDRLLRPGGWLAIMTEMVREDRPFETWRYARDPTHLSFYRPQTMAWIAARFGWAREHPHPNVVFFRQRATRQPLADP
jgi:SAM-dependent methyltransferase